MSNGIRALPINTYPAPLAKAIRNAEAITAQVVPFGSIAATYPSTASISFSAYTNVAFVLIYLTNTTNQPLWFSWDGQNDHGYLLAGQSKTFNFMADRRTMAVHSLFVRAAGTTPTSGELIFEGYR